MSRRSWSAAAVAVISSLLAVACAAGGTVTPGASASAGAHATARPDMAALRSQMVAAVKQARSVHVSGPSRRGHSGRRWISS